MLDDLTRAMSSLALHDGGDFDFQSINVRNLESFHWPRVFENLPGSNQQYARFGKKTMLPSPRRSEMTHSGSMILKDYDGDIVMSNTTPTKAKASHTQTPTSPDALDRNNRLRNVRESTAQKASPLPSVRSVKSIPTSQVSHTSAKSSKITKKAGTRKKELSQAVIYSQKFILGDATELLTQNGKHLLQAWTSLVKLTSFPPDVSIVDLNLHAAVSALNYVITGQEPHLQPRFGSVQLLGFLEALEKRRKQGRMSGLITSKIGHGDATGAIDVYLETLFLITKTRCSRNYVSKLKQQGERWCELSKGSVLSLAIYSKMAETFVHVILVPLTR
ncbi:hypothetical protein HIM_10109 [Hirsutella minnesotensis 3608]|uniref:Uncharacterized protein n=1 Tax=Hirsutella minnesotensis 3608 TaxID=1043627 RepID=A0A0F7ZKE2_9HYPO|nr:hypothetical protein HIM_10109 [Hirsutella minnesotensis 3608]